MFRGVYCDRGPRAWAPVECARLCVSQQQQGPAFSVQVTAARYSFPRPRRLTACVAGCVGHASVHSGPLCFIHSTDRALSSAKASLRSASMGAGASTLRGELIDKRQALMAAGDRFDEAAFDAAAVDGRVPRAVLIEISSWLQTIRDGATELDLTGPTLLGGRVGAGPAGSRKRGTMRLARLRCRAPCHGRAVLLSCDACRLVGCCTPQGRKSALRARELWRPCSRGTQRSRCSTSTVRGSVLGGGGLGGDRVSFRWSDAWLLLLSA